MSDFTREQLHAFLDDALSETESARIERALRDSEELRQQLIQVMQERDRGEHSIGAIWRRHRLSCPNREQLGSYLLGVLDEEHLAYIRFHLETVECPYCQANLSDLQEQQQNTGGSQQRRKRIFQKSAGFLNREEER
jgi:hypothetical protein